MRWLRIENVGELPKEALLLMGASTKRHDTDKIGMFGTGTKYAVATLVREKIPVEIHSGEKRFRFATREVSLRGQSFSEVVLLEGKERNGTPTNLTTDLGLGWTVEMALRELVSNAMDEEALDIQLVNEEPAAEPGTTRVYVKFTPEVQSFFEHFDEMFTLRRVPIEAGPGWAIYRPIDGRARVYRKGVLVWDSPEKVGAFDYRMDDIRVDEKRRADYWDLRYKLGKVLDSLSIERKKKVLRHIEATSNSLEGDLSAEYYISRQGKWIEALEEKVVFASSAKAVLGEEMELVEEKIILPESWAKALEQQGARGAKDILDAPRLKGYKTVPPEGLSPAETTRLNAALEFLQKAGIETQAVEVFEAPKDCIVWGEWVQKGDRVLLNRVVLGKTKREVVSVLLEEFIHRKSGATDKTRAFQEALKNEWLTLAQEKVGEYF